MIPTFKRRPAVFRTDLKNTNKHFNHITFKGIVHKNNIYEVDQLSLKDAVNVYRDEDLVLVSRDPITRLELPPAIAWSGGSLVKVPIIPDGYDLVDIFESGLIEVFVSKHNDLYRIVARLHGYETIMILPYEVTNYHISAIERYIIVFNNVGAMVLEADKFEEGWQPFQNYVEIPLTKRVVGQKVFEYPANQFTESYKEAYVWGDETVSILPDGDAEVEINQSPKNITWTLPNANINTEFRILRPTTIKLAPTDIVSSAFNQDLGINILCIAKSGYVLISFTGGVSFKKVLYPEDATFLNVASVSDTGSHFYFVGREGVYRYTIGSEDGEEDAWVIIRLKSDLVQRLTGMGYYNTCRFYDSETFAFILADDADNIRLYAKSPELTMEAGGEDGDNTFAKNTLGWYKYEGISVNDQLNKAREDCATKSIAISITDGHPTIVAALPKTPTTSTFITIIGKGSNNCVSYTNDYPERFFMVYEAIEGDNNSVDIKGLTLSNGIWYTYDGVLKSNEITITPTRSTNISLAVSLGAPLDLGHGYIVNKTTYSVDGVANLPNELSSQSRYRTIVLGASYYIHIGDTLYSNQMVMEQNATITYTRLGSSNFTEVPQVSHTNNELYLGFGDTLKITDNVQTGIELSFSLPIINNQSFVSSVNGILTISTTETAIFLKDKIFVVTRAPDELLGYSYHYHNTRLSAGIRPYDDVINSIDGVFTFYPTKQGLAVMNYQPDVATTDQAIEYVTKDISKLWTDFYLSSSTIKLVQMKDYIFVTNGTNEYLMLDMRGLTWWKFKLPVPVYKILTDQFSLDIISDTLYTFNKGSANYRDLGELFINWRVESQPLHFGLPSHYKNIRQIIYQLEESTGTLQTVLSQIKLYRKSITYKEPDILKFKVDGYRTDVKRFNYWKVNELQWALAADPDTKTPAQLRLAGLTIKYEPGEEVR